MFQTWLENLDFLQILACAKSTGTFTIPLNWAQLGAAGNGEVCWLHGSAVERQSLASVLSPSCAQPVADG